MRSTAAVTVDISKEFYVKFSVVKRVVDRDRCSACIAGTAWWIYTRDLVRALSTSHSSVYIIIMETTHEAMAAVHTGALTSDDGFCLRSMWQAADCS